MPRKPKSGLPPAGASAPRTPSSGSSAQLKVDQVVEGATRETTLPLLLNALDVAELLRTSRKAIYKMVESAALPEPIRIGRRLLFHRDDLLAWIDERRALSAGGR